MEVRQDGDIWAVKVNEQVISRALSIRQNDRCAEVYVETMPRFRQLGFGSQAAAAWAHQVIKSGRVAFYSYRKANFPSAALARSRGIEWYADVVTFEPL